MAKSFICRQTNLPCNDSNQQEEDRGKTYCEGETVKTNYINFVSEACLLLRKLFKIMSSKIVSIPPSILDFINEVTQIPCLENQVSMVKSTFFEDISYMAGFFESKENIEQRKFNFVYEDTDDPILGLMEIYEKGVGLALSNF